MEAGAFPCNNCAVAQYGVMDAKMKELYAAANSARALYGLGKISREETIKRIAPYVTEANVKARELTRKFGASYKPITITGFLR